MFLKYRKSGEIEARVLRHGDVPVIQFKGTKEMFGIPGEDWLARDPDNHVDQWIITKDYFEKHYEAV